MKQKRFESVWWKCSVYSIHFYSVKIAQNVKTITDNEQKRCKPEIYNFATNETIINGNLKTEGIVRSMIFFTCQCSLLDHNRGRCLLKGLGLFITQALLSNAKHYFGLYCHVVSAILSVFICFSKSLEEVIK